MLGRFAQYQVKSTANILLAQILFFLYQWKLFLVSAWKCKGSFLLRWKFIYIRKKNYGKYLK